MKCSKKIFLTMVTVLLMVSSSFAEGTSFEERQKRREKRLQQRIEALNLSSDQKKQVKEQHQKVSPQMNSLRQKARQNREALHEELIKPETDSQRLAGYVAGLKQVKGEMIEKRTENFLEMKKILSPDQFRSFMKSHQKKKKS